MSTGIFTLADKLQGLNSKLHQQRCERVPNAKLRAALETSVGEFRLAKRLSSVQTEALFQGRALVGVDGSVAQVGGNYPYTVHLFKSLAKTTKPDRNGVSTVEQVEVLTPLLGEDLQKIRQFLDERRHEIRVAEGLEDDVQVDGMAEQQAYFLLADHLMVEMELRVAVEAMKRFSPYLLLMDGGFSRLKGKGGDLWDEFEDLALTMGTIVVGVIEEVGSFRLQTRLQAHEEVLNGFVHRHDRELLFGTLHQGEWLKTSLDRPIKNDFYTVFTRLSDLPQAGACDFLRGQADVVDEVIDFLYTITPSKSRGIPLWLDVVDSEVRLTKKQIDLIVKSNVDVENIESFLRPQRDRRDF